MRTKALIVEDEPNTRALLRSLVEGVGCEVHEAADGERAIELIDRNEYGLILLDIALPKVSGAAVMEHLRGIDEGALARVIVVTGLNVDEIRLLFPTVCQALSKPVMPSRLLQSIRKCLQIAPDTQFTAL